MKRVLVVTLLFVSLLTLVVITAAQQQNQPADAVSILGQVTMPGVYRIRDDNFSLVRAITLAQGLTARADPTMVTITRPGEPTVTIDFASVLTGSKPDIIIKAGDVIRVPELSR